MDLVFIKMINKINKNIKKIVNVIESSFMSPDINNITKEYFI